MSSKHASIAKNLPQEEFVFRLTRVRPPPVMVLAVLSLQTQLVLPGGLTVADDCACNRCIL